MPLGSEPGLINFITLNLSVTRTGIKPETSLKFGRSFQFVLGLLALEHLNSPYLTISWA